MSEQIRNIIVVARPGFQVLLNIGNDCLTIDAFNPVDLSSMYSEDILSNCGSLAAHLRDKNLIYYDGQKLPKDPNSQKIAELRESAAQHIQAQFKQTAQNVNHPNMQLETNAENVNVDREKSLQDQVVESRKQIEQVNQKIRNKMAHNYSDDVVDTPQESLNPTLDGPGIDEDRLVMKVAMDVDPQTFATKQKIIRNQLDTREQEAEEKARAEIESLENEDDNSTTGGQQ